MSFASDEHCLFSTLDMDPERKALPKMVGLVRASLVPNESYYWYFIIFTNASANERNFRLLNILKLLLW